MAVQCPFDKMFKARSIGDTKPSCLQCPLIADDIVNDGSFILAKGTQDTSCQNCKSLYDLQSRTILEEFFFQEHCLEYTPPPPPPPPPPPEPEVVEPEPEPVEEIEEPIQEEEEISEVETEAEEEVIEEEFIEEESESTTIEISPEDLPPEMTEAFDELLEVMASYAKELQIDEEFEEEPTPRFTK